MTDVPAFDLTFGSPAATRHGVVLDTHPDDRIDDLRHHVRSAVGRALECDRDGRGHSSLPAHLSLGYSYADRNGDQLADALRWVRPSHVTTRISSVHLVDLLFEEVPVDGQLAWQLSWTRVAEIHLRPTQSVSPRRQGIDRAGRTMLDVLQSAAVDPGAGGAEIL